MSDSDHYLKLGEAYGSLLSGYGVNSPIEVRLLAALIKRTTGYPVFVPLIYMDGFWDDPWRRYFMHFGKVLAVGPVDRADYPTTYSALIPQAKVHVYRLDFAVLGEGIKIAVECDGHDFHERTKEQAAHDRKRDRFLASHGWTVMRFTGSEIYRDAASCAREIGLMQSKLATDFARSRLAQAPGAA